MAELARTKLALAGKQPDDMLALPRMTNPQKLAAMRILMLATAPAYFEDQNLLPLLALRMVRLSVALRQRRPFGLWLCHVWFGPLRSC